MRRPSSTPLRSTPRHTTADCAQRILGSSKVDPWTRHSGTAAPGGQHAPPPEMHRGGRRQRTRACMGLTPTRRPPRLKNRGLVGRQIPNHPQRWLSYDDEPSNTRAVGPGHHPGHRRHHRTAWETGEAMGSDHLPIYTSISVARPKPQRRGRGRLAMKKPTGRSTARSSTTSPHNGTKRQLTYRRGNSTRSSQKSSCAPPTAPSPTETEAKGGNPSGTNNVTTQSRLETKPGPRQPPHITELTTYERTRKHAETRTRPSERKSQASSVGRSQNLEQTPTCRA